MLCGLLASILESVGDYYACARMSGAPPPPRHAMNRGIGAEGVGCLLAGAFGCGIDTTSYGENIGAIGITKVKTNFMVFYIFADLGVLVAIHDLGLKTQEKGSDTIKHHERLRVIYKVLNLKSTLQLATSIK